MIKFSGKISIFGGKDDLGMVNDTGLALYELKEADARRDLFYTESELGESCPTWKRLKTDSFYCAYRFDPKKRRSNLQKTMVIIENPRNKKWLYASLVDWGPSASTNRVLDVSPGVAKALGIKTDDEVEVAHDV